MEPCGTPHVNFICSRLNKVTGVLSRLKHQLPTYVLLTIYNSLFSSLILYGISVWGCSPRSHLDRLVKLQKRAIRHVAAAKYISHTDPIFKRFKVLKLTDAYHLQCCKLFYKKKIRTLHSYHASRLPTAEHRRTRQWNDVIISRHTSIFQTQSINYKIGHCWNTLPFEIKTIESLCEKSFAGAITKIVLIKILWQMHGSPLLCL